VLIDLSPLRRSRDLRCLVLGELGSVLGTQLTTVAVPYQVYQLTHSSLAVGLVSLAQLFPLIAGSLLAVAGWADVISAVFRNTIIQLAVPDALRGRLSGLQIAVVTGGPRIGDLESGAVAAAFGDTVSVVSGGLACIAGALLLARLLPGFGKQRTPEPRV